MASNGVKNGVNKVSVVLGAQWGDEGKGKLVDLLAENADVVARCQVSRNSASLANSINKIFDSKSIIT